MLRLARKLARVCARSALPLAARQHHGLLRAEGAPAGPCGLSVGPSDKRICAQLGAGECLCLGPVRSSPAEPPRGGETHFCPVAGLPPANFGDSSQIRSKTVELVLKGLVQDKETPCPHVGGGWRWSWDTWVLFLGHVGGGAGSLPPLTSASAPAKSSRPPSLLTFASD